MLKRHKQRFLGNLHVDQQKLRAQLEVLRSDVEAFAELGDIAQVSQAYLARQRVLTPRQTNVPAATHLRYTASCWADAAQQPLLGSCLLCLYSKLPWGDKAPLVQIAALSVIACLPLDHMH